MAKKKTRAKTIVMSAREKHATAVVNAAHEFVQDWLAHPRDERRVGRSHWRLIHAVLDQRKASGL